MSLPPDVPTQRITLALGPLDGTIIDIPEEQVVLCVQAWNYELKREERFTYTETIPGTWNLSLWEYWDRGDGHWIGM